jgi:hypothetical protein
MRVILQGRAWLRDSFTIAAMSFSLRRFAKTRPWAFELLAAVLGLVLGIALMPVLIYYVGVAALGRYEGASLERLYSSLVEGLGQASIAAWVVVLGPYGVYLLLKALRGWWRASAHFG